MITYKGPIVCLFLGGLVAVDVASVGLADCPHPEPRAKGKISRNFYRIPYADGTSVLITDYVNHCPPGSMDCSGPEPANPAAYLVAAADGVVTWVEDSHNECGCPEPDPPSYPCVNSLYIQHANGETSCYFHLKQFSAQNSGITCGMFVNQDTIIGIEGDVGITCGNDGPPRNGPCYTSVPGHTGDCEGHLHWAVMRSNPDPGLPFPSGCCATVTDPTCAVTPDGELINPMTCGIPGNIYAHGAVLVAGPCSASGCPPTSNPTGNFTGWGTFQVYQASNAITASSFTIENQASSVMHAGNRVHLLPGFRAAASSYFRAEIGPCNTTAFAP